MATPESPFDPLDTPVDIVSSLAHFGETYNVPGASALRASNIVCRDGQATITQGPNGPLATMTKRELLGVTDFWIDEPEQRPRNCGPQTLTFLRAFCGYEPALQNLARLERNRAEEQEQLARAPLGITLLDTVVIGNESHSLVTGQALQRYVRQEAPSNKGAYWFSTIMGYLGRMLAPDFRPEPKDAQPPVIVQPGLAYLGPPRTDRVCDWGIAPKIFPLSYQMLGEPKKNLRHGHTPRCDAVIKKYITALERTA